MQKQIAKKLDLSNQQVYKWCWDQQQKRHKHVEQEKKEGKTPSTDEFGGYSKQWLVGSESKKDLDNISSLLGIDIESKAKEIANKGDEAT